MDVSSIVLLLIVPLFFAGIQSAFHVNCETCERVKHNNLNVVDFVSRFATSSLYTMIATVLPCLSMFECESFELRGEPNPVILNTIALGSLLVIIFVVLLLTISVVKAQVKNKWVKTAVPVVSLIAAIVCTLFIILLNIKK